MENNRKQAVKMSMHFDAIILEIIDLVDSGDLMDCSEIYKISDHYKRMLADWGGMDYKKMGIPE